MDKTISSLNEANKATAATAVIDYLLDDGTEERIKDLFDFYDEDGNGMIQREELFNVLALCAHEIGLEVDAYLHSIVDAVFSNAKLTDCGSITFEGLKDVLKERPNLSNELALVKTKTNLNDSTASSQYGSVGRRLVNFKLRGPNEDQNYSYNSEQNQSSSYETVSKLASIIERWDSFAKWVSQWIPIFAKARWEYISNNLVRFNFFLIIVLVCLALYIGRIISYWSHCGWLISARASGQCLNFLCSTIVLLVCRRSTTLLRSKGFGRYLPLDDHIYFHKMIGIFIMVHSVLHTIGHLFNFLLASLGTEAKFTYAEYLFSTKPGIGWIGHCASITGWFLLVILAVMSLAQPFSRSLGKFELFYYTHLLYIPFWILLFIHAPRFWYWFIGPCTVFLIETLIRLRNLLTNLTTDGQTSIIRAITLPSNVIHLVIKRPPNFDYNPGDWIYVLIPQIAKYEWHPFTISSAPEQEGVIWLHIRAVGEWTRSLRSYFEGLENRNHLSKFIRSGQFSMSMDQFMPIMDSSPSSQVLTTSAKGRPNKLGQLRANNIALSPIPENQPTENIKCTELASYESGSSCQTESTNISDGSSNTLYTIATEDSVYGAVPQAKTNPPRPTPNLKVFIDGPYGSPSSQIFRAEHAVLIATGIGVTPFASILQSIVLHCQKRRQRCPSCQHQFSDPRPPIQFKLRKVDFVWINRDQKSFEWFIKLMAELELTQSQLPPSERFLDIHIHLTGMAPAKIKSIGLQLALYLVHEKNKKDLVTGLRTRTKVGRPKWDEFFTDILEQKRGKVSVFFCGRPQLGRQLHRLCDSFGFKFRKEIF